MLLPEMLLPEMLLLTARPHASAVVLGAATMALALGGLMDC